VYDSSPLYTLYAEDDLAIGYEWEGGSANITYKFVDVPPSMFAMNSTFTGCSDAAYTPPTNNTCPTDDKDSASCAFAKSVLFMVIIAIIQSLF